VQDNRVHNRYAYIALVAARSSFSRASKLNESEETARAGADTPRRAVTAIRTATRTKHFHHTVARITLWLLNVLQCLMDGEPVSRNGTMTR
jgi:hypothetical protein